MSKSYEKLKASEKINALSIVAGMLALKPELVDDVSSYDELIDKLEEFARELYGKIQDKPEVGYDYRA